jgi:peptidoglycan-associated lipoprotein
MGRRLALIVLALSVGSWALYGCGKKTTPSTAEGAVQEGTPEGTSAEGVAETGAGAGIGAEGSMPTVHFDFDQYTIRSQDFDLLQRTADTLKQSPSMKITIEGHCDERGSNEYNLALGERRANSVFDYLARLGIDRGRMGTISYGEERPSTTGSGEDAWAQNRRAELVVNR